MKTLKTGLPLLVLFALYYVIPLEFRHLWQPDETRYAEISREMLTSGNWIVPHFLDFRYFEKPVAGYWINNLGQWLFGDSNYAVRFGAVFSTSLTALLVYWLAWRMWRERQTALMAAMIYLSCLQVYGIGSYAVLDPMITLWLVAAMCSFWLAAQALTARGKALGYLLLGLVCGMGFMTKGFLALAVPVVAVLPWVIQQRRWRELLLFGPLAIAGAIAISLPWALAIARQEPDFWHYFFWVEHIQRFAKEDAQHKAPFWYYLPVLIAGSLPWLGLLPGALWRGWRLRLQDSGGWYLLGWVLMPLLFFSIAKGKLLTYILPCFAPLAILMAAYVRQQISVAGVALRANGWINLLFGSLCLLAVLLVLAPWGVTAHPVYGTHELSRVLLAAAIFVCWALVGGLSIRDASRRWPLAVLCPLGLALLIGSAIPQQVENSKQPQAFIATVRNELADSRYILADSPGVAAALAWEMKRSDIDLFEEPGELEYGVNYPDSRQRLIDGASFADWLAQRRRSGSVALVLLLARDETSGPASLPKADITYRQGRFMLYRYQQQP